MGYWVEDANGKFLFNVSIHGLKHFRGIFDSGYADVPALVKRLKELGGDGEKDAKKVLKAKPPIMLTDGTGG